MRKDDLYITVPSLFRCPISLDVMKSPVSLCTGVTYDRCSIQRWLDSGNNTCPATMQVLQTKELVPNHTLQRLIQIWSDSVKTQTESNKVNSVLLTHEQVRELIKQFRVHTDLDVNSERLSKLLAFSEESSENKRFVASISTESNLLVVLTSYLVQNPKNLKVMEKIVPLWRMLVEQRVSVSKIGRINDVYPAILSGLKHGSLKMKIEMTKAVELIISTDSEAKSTLSENTELYSVLLSFSTITSSSDWNPELMEVSISSLISFAMLRKNRVNLVKAGAVKTIGKALPLSSTGLTDKLLRLLELISTCKEGRIEICNDTDCVQAIVKKVLKVSNEATEHAVTILWSLCCLFRDHKAQESVAKSNGMAKILLLLQSNCSPAVRQMAADLLKVFRVNPKAVSCLSTSYDTKTTHIMPF
ncbi:U-box domain-containing protein 27-like [Lycium ferocissimum]|uniref:U-box domain-containing protein 27-like n=1 Tax=Lycium ferocissimum TaxID=112874 RepID=UPI00281694A5|nr:U-box domain-containing protein 27-like [Lycium ferocissimum]